MTTLLLALSTFLLLNLGAGMAVVFRGRRAADRVIAAQLFGTTTVAILLLLAEATGVAALRDVGLVFVLLATLLTVAFVRLPTQPEEREP